MGKIPFMKGNSNEYTLCFCGDIGKKLSGYPLSSYVEIHDHE